MTEAPAGAANGVDYVELSATELVKLINEEYGLVLASERNNLQRAIAIGEKLAALEDRVDHGEWQEKLKGWCPKLSYETATLYIRLWKKRGDLEEAAKAKSARVTDLTIVEARKLLAKPPKPGNGNGPKGRPAPAGGVEPAPAPTGEAIAKQYLREVWAPDELISVLREVRDQEYLTQLSVALAKATGPKAIAA